MLTNIAIISYSVAAIAYLFLSVLLLTSWRGRLYGMMLTIAVLLAFSGASSFSAETVGLEQGFRNVPDGDKPWVYYWWVAGNVDERT
ncbi:MAG: hypothetical protein AAB306_03235, partial [Pseudomonadota bacterium]